MSDESFLRALLADTRSERDTCTTVASAEAAL